jgi:hypothetical protein
MEEATHNERKENGEEDIDCKEEKASFSCLGSETSYLRVNILSPAIYNS